MKRKIKIIDLLHPTFKYDGDYSLALEEHFKKQPIFSGGSNYKRYLADCTQQVKIVTDRVHTRNPGFESGMEKWV